jgi:RND family efflux transporter MFP subunit
MPIAFEISHQRTSRGRPGHPVAGLTAALLIPALLGFASGLAGCTPQSDGDEEALTATVVETATAHRGAIEATIRQTGDVLAGNSVRLFGQIPDRLIEVSVDVGSRVQRGQVLARIRDEGVRAGVEQIEANLRAAESSLANLTDELARSRSLHAVGAVSNQALEALETQHRSGQALVEQLRAALDQAQASFQNAVISAPFSGVIAERFLEAGDMAGPGFPVFRLVNMQMVKVRTEVSQESLGQVGLDMPARVTVSSYPGEVFHGDVINIAPVLDPMTRLTTVEIGIDNSDGRLKAGMFAEVTLVVQSLDDALLIPIDALLEEYRYISLSRHMQSEGMSEPAGIEAALYVVEGNTAVLKQIRIGLVGTRSAQVLSGLNPGSRVVTVGKYRLSEGDLVEIRQPGGDAPAGGER